MLNTLRFHLTTVTPLRFLQYFMHLPGVEWMAPKSPQAECAFQLCMYLIEMQLQFVDFLQFKPSTVAAAVLYTVRAHCHTVLAQQADPHRSPPPFEWSAHMEQATRHSALDLQPCAQVLYQHWTSLTTAGSQALLAAQAGAAPPQVGGNKCLAVYRKYTKEKHGMVSQIRLLQPPFQNL